MNAEVPAKDLSKKGIVPNLFPINAAAMSEIINIEKAVTITIFGNIQTHKEADIRTHEAPFKTNFFRS